MIRKVFRVTAILLLLAGLGVLAYHPYLSWRSEQQKKETLENFNREMSAIAGQENTDMEEKKGETEGGSAGNSSAELLSEMQKYNRSLFETGQSGLVDAWSYEQPAFDLKEYGLDTDIIGSIRIPAMEVELPLYLGATEENMAKGAVILGQTSMPVGGENTNCVIAGHRGYRSEAYFREIENLQNGDRIYLDTIFGELEYKVESTAVIEPDNIDAIRLQEGKDMLTLVTCHPYTVGTHRYIVYCSAVSYGPGKSEQTEAVPEAEGDRLTEAAGDTPAPDTFSRNRILLEKWLPFAAVPLIILALILLIVPKRNKKR